MTPALPTMPRPGSMIVSGMRLPKCFGAPGRSTRRRPSTAGTLLRYFVGKPPPRLTIERWMPRSAHSRKTAEAEASATSHGFRVALLRADVERHPVGLEPEPVGVLEHVDRHLGHAAELPRQRPFGAGAVAQDAAEHLDVLGPARAAARAIFSTSASQSTANRRTPSSRARAMSRSFLIVLPKEMRSGVAPAPARARSRPPRPCRSTSRARPGASAPPARGSPSRRRTRACRAAPGRTSW